MPKAESKPSGAGITYLDDSGSHWLGAHQDPRDASKIVWCIELGSYPIGQGETVSIETLDDAKGMTIFRPTKSLTRKTARQIA